MSDHELLTWTPEMVTRFWDYEAKFPKNFFTYSRSHQIIRQIRKYLPQHCSVLDYGCGPGNLIGPLLDAGYRVSGLDYSAGARDSVAASFGGRDGFEGVYDQDEILKAGLKFDAIIVAEVIEHLYDAQLNSLLDTLKGLSKPETSLIFTTPNEEDLQASYILCPVSGQLFHRWQHVRNWSRETVRDYLMKQNFADVHTYTTDFDTTLAIQGKNHPLRGRWWTSLHQSWRYLRQPQRKRPHLVVIARPA